MRWLAGCGVCLVVACGSPRGSSGGSEGVAGTSGSAGSSFESPDPCFATFAACPCEDGFEGYQECNADDAVVCNCDAPVSTAPLASCFEPCGGDVSGDWQLIDVCGPRWESGNCEHPVRDFTAEFSQSGLSFSQSGVVSGNLAYTATLQTDVTQICANRKLGSADTLNCLELEEALTDELSTSLGPIVTGNTCFVGGSGCECKTDLSIDARVDAPFTLDASAQRVSFQNVSFEYCATGETLSLRGSKDELTFTFGRPKLSLPFEAIAVGKVEGAPTAASGLNLAEGDCKTVTTADTDTLLLDCGSDRVRGAQWGDDQVNTFFLRSLVVPPGKRLVFKGSKPAIVVADVIEIHGSLSFIASASAAGAGTAGSNQAGGGGGHCTAGGGGGFWTGDSARLGGPAHGSFEALSFGGPGGSATYTYTNDAHPGGAGGGAIALIAATSINVTGTIDVSGQVGTATGPTPQYGAGGGAGGMIALEAPAITITATAKLRAAGARGAGQEGGNGSTSASPGENGGTEDASTLGGGGGGVGRILIKSSDGGSNIDRAALTPTGAACALVETL